MVWILQTKVEGPLSIASSMASGFPMGLKLDVWIYPGVKRQDVFYRNLGGEADVGAIKPIRRQDTKVPDPRLGF